MTRKMIAPLLSVLLLACVAEADSMRPVRAADRKLRVIHDDVRDVTCWVYEEPYGLGLSCLRDAPGWPRPPAPRGGEGAP
jgi:hypothetical protein